MTMQPSEGRPIGAAVGETIHMHMWRRKISQAEVGGAIGVGQSTLSKKLRGEVRLDVDELMTIARLLGVEPGDLLPRLDSNQQPSGYSDAQVSELLVSARRASNVIELATWRDRVAS